MNRLLIFVFSAMFFSKIPVSAQVEGVDFFRLNTAQFSVPKIHPEKLGIKNLEQIEPLFDFFVTVTNVTRESCLVDSMRIFLPPKATSPKVHFTSDDDAIVEWIDGWGDRVFKRISKDAMKRSIEELRKKEGGGVPAHIEIKNFLRIQFVIPIKTRRKFSPTDPDVSIWEPRPHAVF